MGGTVTAGRGWGGNEGCCECAVRLWQVHHCQVDPHTAHTAVGPASHASPDQPPLGPSLPFIVPPSRDAGICGCGQAAGGAAGTLQCKHAAALPPSWLGAAWRPLPHQGRAHGAGCRRQGSGPAVQVRCKRSCGLARGHGKGSCSWARGRAALSGFRPWCSLKARRLPLHPTLALARPRLAAGPHARGPWTMKLSTQWWCRGLLRWTRCKTATCSSILCM